MPDPTFTPGPPAPSRGQPATFSSRMDTFLAWLGVFGSEVAASVPWFAQAVADVDADATQTGLDRIQTGADRVQTGLDRVQTGLDAVDAASMRKYYLGPQAADPTLDRNGDPVVDGAWYDNTTSMQTRIRRGGAWVTAVFSASGGLMASNNLSDLTNLDTARANLGVGNLIRVARTSNTLIAANNRGQLIDITSGTFTQTFAAAATLGNGWSCYIRNSGAGDITLDPNGAETIDGLTTFIMYPGEVRLVQCDGTALRSIVVSGFKRVFTASGTFYKPPGYSRFGGMIWGGGGGGGTGSDTNTGGGGGASLPFVVPASAFTDAQSFTIGAGGAIGAQGGITTLGGLKIYGGAGGGAVNNAGGGGGAFAGPASSAGGAPSDGGVYGGSTSQNTNLPSDQTMFGGTGGTSGSGNAGSSLFGGGGGGGNTGLGGVSKFGGNGGAFGVAGSAPGGAGGLGAVGARGEVHIYGVA